MGLVIVTFLIACVLIPQAVYSHTYLSSVVVGGKALPEGDCVRPHPSTAFDSPIPLVTAADMTCGWLPSAANNANYKCAVAAGSSIGIQWHHSSTDASDDIIASTHVGPCLVYMAKSDSGAGNVWFKIFEQGYTNGAWCVTNLINNKGLLTVTIPSDIAPGNYLLRGEILALHSAYSVNGVQPYVGCVELTVSGSGTATPAGVAFPGYYSPTGPGMIFNVYNSFTSYPTVGPALYVAKSSSSTGSSSTGSSSTGSSSTGSSSTGSSTTGSSTTGSKPAANPTVAPAKATTAPAKATTAPAKATTAPATAPTANPASGSSNSGSGSSVKVQVHTSSSSWWFAVAVTSSSTVTKLELTDSGSQTSWAALSYANWGYWIFPAPKELVLPISLRVSSSSNSQTATLVLSKFISSFTDVSLRDTYLNFANVPVIASPSVVIADGPVQAPASSSDDSAPVVVDTSVGTVSLQLHEGSSVFWLGVDVRGAKGSTSTLEIHDATSSTFQPMTLTTWDYWVWATSNGVALVAPISFRLTSQTGYSIIVTTSSTDAGTSIQTGISY